MVCELFAERLDGRIASHTIYEKVEQEVLELVGPWRAGVPVARDYSFEGGYAIVIADGEPGQQPSKGAHSQVVFEAVMIVYRYIASADM